MNVNHKVSLNSFDRKRLNKKIAFKTIAKIKTGSQNKKETFCHLRTIAIPSRHKPI